MPGRSSLAEVEQAYKQLAALQLGFNRPPTETFVQQCCEPLVVSVSGDLLLYMFVLTGTQSDVWQPCTSGFTTATVEGSTQAPRLAIMQVLATSCSKISDHKLLEQSGKVVLQTLKAHQDAKTAIGPKGPSNRLYTPGFRALNHILATLRSQHGLSTAELLELLRHFFTYGVELSLASPVPVAAALGVTTPKDSASASNATYSPPHARRQSTSSAGRGPHRWHVCWHSYSRAHAGAYWQEQIIHLEQ